MSVVGRLLHFRTVYSNSPEWTVSYQLFGDDSERMQSAGTLAQIGLNLCVNNDTYKMIVCNDETNLSCDSH